MHNVDVLKLNGHTLKVFASVCETSSISKTAALFDLNQSTISHSIDRMSTAVGASLFIKCGRGIAPTEEALSLMPRVQRIIADLEGLSIDESYDVTQDKSPFVIAIPTPALLHDVKAMHSTISRLARDNEFVIRRHAPRDRAEELLARQEADLVIAVSGLSYPVTLNHCHYGSERLMIFYDDACRGPVDTLKAYSDARHGVVNFGGGMKSEVAKALEERGVHRKIGIAAPTASMLGDLIHGTDIIATMPERLARGAYAHLSTCKPPLALPDIHYDLVWHRRHENSGRNVWLREVVMEASRSVRG